MTVQDLLHEVDAARVTAWDAGTRRAALVHEAGLAEEHAAVAKRRIPELEAEKKAAATARVSLAGLHVNQVHAAQGAVAGCSSRQGEPSLQPGQEGRDAPADHDAYGPGGLLQPPVEVLLAPCKLLEQSGGASLCCTQAYVVVAWSWLRISFRLMQVPW